jgi:hypothetical protein
VSCGHSGKEELSARTILCAGTTFGSLAAINVYLGLMNRITDELHLAGKEILCSLDQGIHNYIAYRGLLGARLAILSNEDGLVNTLGYARKRLDGSGWIIDDRNQVSAVVHQFNRMNVADLKRYESLRHWPCRDLYENRNKIKPGNVVSLEVEWPADSRQTRFEVERGEVAVGAAGSPPSLSARLLTLYEGDSFPLVWRVSDGSVVAGLAKIVGVR